ncbi:ABC transporter permease [Lacihabitans soyangensis]|uniref:FtsX-like permease family protein n=1 Tax=Lacihabitans soyangensis TaxID=869394 RepID=A0AAE3H7J0_9BACT|nr:ABC transporter permease [Lacihabitans soyangensis]MCP9765912.1 FtsX-like permease family protein [Lacihabitans soyangensis]
MIRNYFKIAWRNLVKNIGFSAINILGLALGIACCLFIFLYIGDELSFDSFHEKADRVYRINLDVKFGGTEQSVATTSDPLGPTLKKDYPQVENYVRLYSAGPFLVKKSGTIDNTREEKVLFADSTVFEVFTFPLEIGNPKLVLSEPNTIVLSRTSATRYFGNQNPIGQILKLDNNKDFKITGVMKDIPENSHIKAEFFISMKSLNYNWNNFLADNFHTYILLHRGVNPNSFDAYFDQIVKKYIGPELLKAIGSTLDDFKKSGSYFRYSMIPLTDIHLKSKQTLELGVNSDIQYIYIFSIVALVVLLIACINFMNLSTAQSSKRGKEVGIRKVLGSGRIQLMVQFFAECVLLSFFALITALILVIILLPFFNDISNKSLIINNLFSFKFLLFITTLPIIVGLLAGSYPAIFLSSFEPIKVLKGRLNLKGGSLRNVLVIFQFATSIVLIIGTVIIYRQINFIQQKNLGFNKDQVLIIKDAYALGKQAIPFKEEVVKLKGVQNGTLSGFLPTPSNRNNTIIFPEGQIDQNKGVNIGSWDIDYDYIETMGISITNGRNFSKEFGTDSSGLILNETAAKLLGFSNPINEGVNLFMDDKKKIYRIVGVVKDFHFESLRNNIGALCMRLKYNNGNISFKLDAKNDIQSTIKQIEGKWAQMAPGQPFNYTFMDESFNNIYKAEQRIGKISLAFAFLTIFVACMGLFGLVTFIAEQRIKEIGIRKVLGASVVAIISLLSQDFVKLVIVSFSIASPIAYYTMNKWLQDFEFRANIEWPIFALAGLGAILICVLTVSYQAIKAALMNPVKSLKTE